VKPIAIFYHTYFGGGSVPVTTDNAIRIVSEQFGAMQICGLLDAAAKKVVGISGDLTSFMVMSSMAPEGMELVHNTQGIGELPTMKLMQEYCRKNPDHYVCYLHTKGVIHNGAPIYEAWRRCMERVVIGKWKECARALECGYDSAGAHWLMPMQFPFIGPVPYWGGNFFWARADHLNKLPDIDINADRYQAEVWIGKSKKAPRVMDYARHFPMTGCQ